MHKVPVIALSVAAAAGLVYAGGTRVFAGRFPLRTSVNGVGVSFQKVSDLKSLLPSGTASNDYTLTLTGMDGQTDTITGDEIGLTLGYDNADTSSLASEGPNYTWLTDSLAGQDLTLSPTAEYDEDKLRTCVESLIFFTSPTDLGAAADNPEEVTETSASSDTEEAEANVETAAESADPAALSILDEEKVIAAVKTAISSGETSLNLEDAGCYITAGSSDSTEQSVEDASITLAADTLNSFENFTITIPFGSNTETLDGETIRSWLSLDGSSLVIDDDAVNAYVKSLAEKYNTTGRTRSLTTTTGKVVSITPGTYGWILDQSATKQAIVDAINSQTQGEVDPVFSQEAYQFGDQDWGPNYVEIDLDSQHVWVYKDGALVVSTDCVSGNASLGRNTPDGAFYILFKQTDATLTGQGYSSPVNFWMPFYLGCGLHDATWRSSFGGTIYLYNGSHGCINLPYDAAKQIFSAVYAGEPVFVYGGATQDTVSSYQSQAAATETEDSDEDTSEAASTESTEEAADAASSTDSAAAASSVPTTQAEQQAIIDQAVANYEATGMSHDDAVNKVNEDLAAQLAAQQAAAAAAASTSQ
ncbi:MAG: L,D-transpeptidase/peptidoglycan binding protein [Lachnospiraceae bacterium]